MKSTVIALTFAALSVFLGSTPSTFAGDNKVAKGTITAIRDASLTVRVDDHEMAFAIDHSTMVMARGASTKSARLAVAGKPGPRLADVLRAGESVSVTYSELAGSLLASAIKEIPRADAAFTPDHRSNGIVTSTGGDWITIHGSSGGGASFEQTFKIEPHTTIWAKGASRAVAAAGGKAPFSELVRGGDRVSVVYRRTADGLIAADVHVIAKSTH